MHWTLIIIYNRPSKYPLVFVKSLIRKSKMLAPKLALQDGGHARSTHVLASDCSVKLNWRKPLSSPNGVRTIWISMPSRFLLKGYASTVWNAMTESCYWSKFFRTNECQNTRKSNYTHPKVRKRVDWRLSCWFAASWNFNKIYTWTC